MAVVLACGALGIIGTFWRAHRTPGFDFNCFDLVMENGKVSKIAFAFMLVLAVTTWVIVDQQIQGKLTEGMFGLYGGMWVLPLVAKVIFNKADMPGTTTVTSMSETITATVKEPA